METIIFGRWWRNHQSLAREGLCIFRFCVMSWKDAPEPTIKYCLGRQVDVVQEFITIQNFGHNWWWANGIGVDYFLRIHHIAALQQSPRVHVENERKNKNNLQDGSSSCRCSTTSHGDLKTMNRNANLTPTSFLLMREHFHQEDGHSLDLDQKKKWYSACDSKPQGEWDRVAELMTIKFGESGHPVFRAPSPVSRWRLTSKGGGQLSIHFCADGDTIETVFRTITSVNQLSIYGAVSDLCEEYRACHATTVRPVLARQSDPLFVPTSLLMKNTYSFDQWSCARRSIAKVPRMSGKALTTKSCD